jgi:hypothetical protein
MTMTITVNDTIADKVMTFLNSLPKEDVKIEPARPWYADEVKQRADQYRAGEMETYPVDQAFWDEIDDYIDTVA